MFDMNDPTYASAYPLVYRNLMAVGLLGSMYRQHEDAEAINDTVELTLANVQEYRLCRAIAQGAGGNPAAAEALLTRQLDANPDDDHAKVALGLALLLAGKPDWKHWIDNVLATSTDQTARTAANGVIERLKAMH